MGQLPTEKMQPSPPLFCICIDFLEPYSIRGEVQKSIKGKCYDVFFACSEFMFMLAKISC